MPDSTTLGHQTKVVVLVTGSSTGIGRLTAETAARAGHRVFASMREMEGRNREKAAQLEELAREESLALSCIELNVTDEGSVERAVQRILSEERRIDVVVNNAGHMAIGLAEGFTTDQLREQMDVNFLGAFRVSRAVLPQMRERGEGLLIHVTSILGRIVFPGCGVYCASKFALEALAEVMHYELGGQGIESVLVEPGPYPTSLLPNSPGPEDSDRVRQYGPLATFREDFLKTFLDFFASDDSTNPQEVAKTIARLIELPAGQRPLRTVCGPDYGAVRVNEAAAPVQADTLRSLGMGNMASVAS